MALSFGDW
jgi:hypothetical protein